MKKRVLVFLLLLAMVLPQAAPLVRALTVQDFIDVNPSGWAYEYLRRAVEDELLNGSGEEGSRRLKPEGTLTAAEMAAILTRVLKAETMGAPYPGAVEGSWSYQPAAKAMALGILPEDGSWQLNQPVRRGQVFQAMAAAFQLERAPQSLTCLTAFSDMAGQPASVRRAAAALVENGMLKGSGSGRLNPDALISRQEFVAILYRAFSGMADGASLPESADGPVICDTPRFSLQQKDVPYGLVLSAPVRSVWLEGVRMDGPLTVRSARLESMTMQNAVLSRLVLAVTGGDVSLRPMGESRIETLVIGQNSGSVSFQGSAGAVEVTGSGQNVTLGGQAETLVVTGSKNKVRISSGTALKKITLAPGAEGNSVILDGTAEEILLQSTGCSVTGGGRAEAVTLYRDGNQIAVNTGKLIDKIDYGLEGVSIVLSGQDPIPAGGSLAVTAAVVGVRREKIAQAQWYRDGKKVSGFSNAMFPVREGKTSSMSGAIEFTKDMKLTTTVGLELLYTNADTGETERVYGEKTFTIQNYPASHYDRPTVAQVLAKVSNVYKGNYTLSYNPDYTKAEKEVFVNDAKKYSSTTKYLVWVNIGTQKVNVFTGSKGKWTLDRTFRCGTGRQGYDTRQGVTVVTGKQDRWNKAGHYYCAPVVRFFPGTGYAFHSRLYYPIPNNKTLKDSRIGFPISDGCVRMYDADIQWLHKNIPLGTTVVIY